MQSNLIAPHLQAFFAEYLCQQRRLSPHTIVSCRDTFRLLLTFLRDQTGIEPSALRIADVDAPAVLSFLQYLEQQRSNSVRSRNIRLSAIRSFFRLVALREPDSLGIVTRVLAIPMKREDRKLIGYLTRTEMQALLAAPDRSKWVGRRDYALLLTLYNSGARVSEVTALRRDQVCFEASTFVQLTREGPQRADRPAMARYGAGVESLVSGAGGARFGHGVSQCEGQAPLARWRGLSVETGHPARCHRVSQSRHQKHFAACHSTHDRHASAPGWGGYRHHCAVARS